MRLAAVFAVLILASGLAQATPIWPASTGFGVLPGDQDPNWEVLYSSDDTNYVSQGNAYVVVDNGYSGAWLANNAASQWISTRANYPMDPAVEPAGYYMFRTTFTLATVPAEMPLLWAADNQGVRIDLNGTLITLPPGSMTSLEPLVLTSGFVVGQNTLSFVVYNETCPGCGTKPNPVGARMEFVTPEPASLFLIGLGLLGIAGIARRKMR